MTSRLAFSIVLVLSAAVAPASAQWAPYLPPSVPLTENGEPDLDAPAPRTPDGKPDLTGVWQGVRGSQTSGSDAPPIAGFGDVAQNMEGGLPLRPEAARLLEERRARNGADNPEAHCLPMGIMQFHTQGAPRKFIQTPNVLVILYEASMGVRQIFTDGRSLPGEDAHP